MQLATGRRKEKKGKKTAKGSGNLTVDYTRKQDVFCLLNRCGFRDDYSEEMQNV